MAGLVAHHPAHRRRRHSALEDESDSLTSRWPWVPGTNFDASASVRCPTRTARSEWVTRSRPGAPARSRASAHPGTRDFR